MFDVTRARGEILYFVVVCEAEDEHREDEHRKNALRRRGTAESE